VSCSVLQCAAVSCGELRCVAVSCSVLQRIERYGKMALSESAQAVRCCCCSVLLSCSVLQYATVSCSALQYVAVYFAVLLK